MILLVELKNYSTNNGPIQCLRQNCKIFVSNERQKFHLLADFNLKIRKISPFVIFFIYIFKFD